MDMKTLIEFYDKDILKNIVAPLSLKPQKVVYLYDRGITDMTIFTSLEKCLCRSIPGMVLERYPVDIGSVEKIVQQVHHVVDYNGVEGCGMELTGGSELMIIAGFRAGLKRGIQLLHTDLLNNCIEDLNTHEVVAEAVRLTLEDFVDAKGARFIGESHAAPMPSRFEAIKEMAMFLFRHLEEWKPTCSFIQTVASKTQPHDLYIESKTKIRMKNGKTVYPAKKVLKEFQRLGFIRNLIMEDGGRVQFSFCSLEDKRYCIGYGVWLELYVYIAAYQSGGFDDVKLGTMIDWDAYDRMTIAGNEIDVIMMERSLPIFVSCKLRNIDTAAINELLIAKKRLGGWFSKGIIVAFTEEKNAQNSGVHKRSRELGIDILDKNDILSDNFMERLVRTVKENDLVSLKWKKV